VKTPGRCTCLLLAALSAAVPRLASGQAARAVEPVVLTGAGIPDWSRFASDTVCMPYPSGTQFGGSGRDAHNGTAVVPPDARTGVAVGEIVAYRWGGTQFVEVPVQVDERYHYCLSNPPSGFSFYSGTDKELSYAWDVESWKKIDGQCLAQYPAGIGPTPDPVPGLDDDDEIVFMASDAGPQAPALALPPPGTSSGHAVSLIDPLDPSSVKYVYLFRKPGGSAFTAANGYVGYTRDGDADEWIDRYSFRRDDPEVLGVSNTDYGPNLTGSVCRTASYPDPDYPPDPDGTPRASTDRFPRDGVTVSSPSYRWRATGRWMVRGLQAAKPGQPGVYGPDLVDRWKGRAFQQSPDSTISLVGFEDEQVNWEANSALLGERMGPVRAIREVWGADSGTNVTKTETFYRDAITYRYHVRVHPIPPDGLYTSWDYNAGVATTYYNVLKPDGVAIDGVNDDTGNVDGVFGTPAYFDAPDPTFNVPSAILNWEQISGAGDAGSLVYIVEMKGATTALNPAVVPYYRDDACLDDGTGDDPVARPWPGEASTDQRVRDGYSAANGGTPYEQLACAQKQGAWGAHGIHYFFSGDTDNAASPEVLTEIDAQQWQFVVPAAQPANVGQTYGNVVIAPLVKTVLPLLALPSLPDPFPPSAGSSTLATAQGSPAGALLSGSDVDDCELSFTIVTPPAHGSLSAIAGHACALGVPSTDTASVTYTPAAGYFGSDAFTYRVNDGTTDSAPATVSITVRQQAPPVCATGPVTGCRQPVRSQAGKLTLRDRTPDDTDQALWKWSYGAATAKGDYGNPLASTSYQLCVFDGDGRTIGRAGAPAGGVCGGRPCWREGSSTFTYRSRDRRPDGTRRVSTVRLKLKAGGDGQARIVARGTGPTVDLAPLPADQPVTVQLKSSEGACWEAAYSAPARRNGIDQFVDRND
jgi:hypothetical protein